jgi:hypothetical protein
MAALIDLVNRANGRQRPFCRLHQPSLYLFEQIAFIHLRPKEMAMYQPNS